MGNDIRKGMGKVIWFLLANKRWVQQVLFVKYLKLRTTFKVLTGAPTNKFRVKDPNFKEIFYEIGDLRFPVGANSKK